MEKTVKLHLLLPAAVLMMCCGMATLSSCTSDVDNPAPVVVDDKPFDRDQYIDASVRPGDDWYRLFDVKPTDKLYLAPEDRVKI